MIIIQFAYFLFLYRFPMALLPLLRATFIFSMKKYKSMTHYFIYPSTTKKLITIVTILES